MASDTGLHYRNSAEQKLAGSKRPLLREGNLLKRQRGLNKGQNLRGLKFQNRFVRLEADFLFYYVSSRDKNSRGKFPVSSIAFVEKIPAETFPGVQYGFQIGNQDEVMYFGAKNEKEQSEWMETITLATTLAKNKMLSHYHCGAYGKDIPGQWSCCKEKEKGARGCYITQITKEEVGPPIKRTQSEFSRKSEYTSSAGDEMLSSLPAMNYLEDDVEANELLHTKLQENYVKFEKRTRVSELYFEADTQSLKSTDSGYVEKYGSRSSLQSTGTLSSSKRRVVTPAQRQESIPELLDDNGVRLDEITLELDDSTAVTLDEDSQVPNNMLKENGFELKYSSHFDSVVNGLNFRGNDRLIVAERNGKVHVLDALGNAVTSYDYPEVESVESWRNLLLVSSKKGSFLRDLDNEEINYQLPASHQYAGFSPDGSTLVTANAHVMNVHKLQRHKTHLDVQVEQSADLSGQPLWLLVSPDPRLPVAAMGTVESDKLCLHTHDYSNLRTQSVKIGDFNQLCTVPAAFSPLDQESLILAIGHGSSITFVKIKQSHLKVSHQLTLTEQRGVTITSLRYSPSGEDLVGGMSNGVVSLFNGRAKIPTLQHTLDFSIENPPAVTSLSFSRDCSLLALGHDNGTLSMIHRLSMKKAGFDYFMPSNTKTIPSSGGSIHISDDDITIMCPEGFIDSQSVNFKYCVIPHEFFSSYLPSKKFRLISSVLLLEPEESVTFLKPIEVTVPHFIDAETEADCKRISFLKISSDFQKVEEMDGVSLFTKRFMNDENVERRVQYATLYSDHCCYLCSVENITSEDTNKAKFCLTEAKEVSSDSGEVTLHYIVHYDLPTCLKMVKDQYNAESFQMRTFWIKFKDDNDPGIGVRLLNPELLRENKWSYYIENDSDEKKIYRGDICFWDIPSCRQLVEMCRTKNYPPRFMLKVQPSDPVFSPGALLRVTFPGVRYELFRDPPILTLQLKDPRPPPSRSMSRVVSNQSVESRGQSSPISLQRPEEAAIQASTSYICKMVKKSVELPLELYSIHLLTEEQMDKLNIDELAKESEHSQQRLTQNYKILKAVKANIAQDPSKFNDLCDVLDSNEYQSCSERLRDELKKCHGKKKVSVFSFEKTPGNFQEESANNNGLSTEALPLSPMSPSVDQHEPSRFYANNDSSNSSDILATEV